MAKKTGGQYFAGSKSQSSLGRGEYYQPTAIIDKKSGAIWRDAVASVGKSVATVIDKKNALISEKKRRSQDLMDRTAKYALDKGTQVFDNLQKQGVNNPSIINAWQGLLAGDVENYRNSISAGTPEEQKIALENMAKTQKQMGQMSTLIDQSNESQALYDKDVQSGNLLGQGTLNLSGEKNMEWAKMMNIRAGTNKGTETWGLDEDGDWSVTFEGDELDGAVTKKAAMFFGYDPGIIPEVDKFFTGLFQEVGATDKNGEPTDKFLDTKSIIQGTNDPRYSQVAYNVKMDALANATSQQTSAYAKSLAGSLPGAEATWDNTIPEDIKQQVAEEFGVEDYSDLQPGAGFGYGQLDQKSGQMFEKAMLLYAGTKMQNQRLGSVVKNQMTSGKNKGKPYGAGGSGNVDGFVEDFNTKMGMFGIGKNPAGVYTGRVDLDDPNLPQALTAIGFEVVDTYDGENGVVGMKIKPTGQSGTAGTFEVTEKMNAQDFVRDLVNGITKNKNRQLGRDVGYGFKEPNEVAAGLIGKYTN